MLRAATLVFLYTFLLAVSASAICDDYTNFDNLDVPRAAQKECDEARVPSAFGFPRFKKITYRYTSDVGTNAKRQIQIEVEVLADNGLIRIRRQFSPFEVEYLAGFGGLVLFKTRGLGRFADGSVSIAENVHVTVPKLPMQVGAITEISYDMAKFHAKQPGLSVHINETCKATEELEAKAIFPSLTGRAINMVCSGSNATSRSYVSDKIYLEALGLVVPGTNAGNSKTAVAHFSSFDVQY